MYGGGSSGPSFFDLLFGGGRQIQEPTYRPRGAVGHTSNNARNIVR
jgi:hypothetical protein